MGGDAFKTLSSIKSDRTMVFGVDEELELFDAVASRLFNSTLHHRMRGTTALVAPGYKEGADLCPMTRALKPFPAKATKSDELCLIEDASESAKVENFAATLSGRSGGLLLSNQEAQRKITRTFQAPGLPGFCVFCRKFFI